MIVSEALEQATAALPTRRGLPNPHHEALFLLAAAWKVDEIRLRMRPEKAIPAEVERLFFQWVDRRSSGEPAEHIVGRCAFWGRSFRVTPSVLIPRPETELMVQAVIEMALPSGARVADVGTGSGCLAITLAAERPDWRVVGIDRSFGALNIARQNASDLGADVAWLWSDLMSCCGPGFDLVVANLPYIPSGWMPTLGEEISREPVLALDGGRDGLDLVRRLIGDLGRILAPGGLCLLELAEDQAAAVEEMAVKHGLHPAGRRRDIGGCDRIVMLAAKSGP
ncbi:MAG: peptide chain release factor N(5)-glutamine methyltransferase [Acidobacteriota bacterium]